MTDKEKEEVESILAQVALKAAVDDDQMDESDDEEEEEEEEEEDDDDDADDETESSSGSEESFDESTIVRPNQTLLQGRTRRKTAGRRLASLLDDEEAEEESLYKEKYGDEIFKDEASDYEAVDEESWDELDTDFDDDEEVEEETVDPKDDSAREMRKKKNVYMDPLLRAPKRRKKVAPPASTRAIARTPRDKSEKSEKSESQAVDITPLRKSSRSATIDNNNARDMRLKDEKASNKKRASITRKPKAVKKLTQADRLRQAVTTERENRLSLLRFQQKEDAKKKTVIRNTTYNGPVIRYHSKTIFEDGTKEMHNFLLFTESDKFMEKYFPGAQPIKPDPTPPKKKKKAPTPEKEKEAAVETNEEAEIEKENSTEGDGTETTSAPHPTTSEPTPTATDPNTAPASTPTTPTTTPPVTGTTTTPTVSDLITAVAMGVTRDESGNLTATPSPLVVGTVSNNSTSTAVGAGITTQPRLVQTSQTTLAPASSIPLTSVSESTTTATTTTATTTATATATLPVPISAVATTTATVPISIPTTMTPTSILTKAPARLTSIPKTSFTPKTSMASPTITTTKAGYLVPTSATVMARSTTYPKAKAKGGSNTTSPVKYVAQPLHPISVPVLSGHKVAPKAAPIKSPSYTPTPTPSASSTKSTYTARSSSGSKNTITGTMKLTTQNVVKPVLIHPAVVHVPTLQQQQQMIANSKAGLGTPTFGPNGITIPNYSSANTVAVGQTVRGIGGTQIQPNVLPRTNTATSRSSSSTKTKTSASKYTTGLKASGK